MAINVCKSITACVIGFNPVSDIIIPMKIQKWQISFIITLVYAPAIDAEEVDEWNKM